MAEGRPGVLFDQEDGVALLAQPDDDLKDIFDDERGQPGRRFIHHHQRRPGHQGPAHGQHLLFAAGEGAGQLLARAPAGSGKSSY